MLIARNPVSALLHVENVSGCVICAVMFGIKLAIQSINGKDVCGQKVLPVTLPSAGAQRRENGLTHEAAKKWWFRRLNTLEQGGEMTQGTDFWIVSQKIEAQYLLPISIRACTARRPTNRSGDSRPVCTQGSINRVIHWMIFHRYHPPC